MKIEEKKKTYRNSKKFLAGKGTSNQNDSRCQMSNPFFDARLCVVVYILVIR